MQARLTANAKWKAKYPEKARAIQYTNSRRWRTRNPLAYMLSGTKQRAKTANLEFSITKDDFPAELPTHCPVLGLELVYGGYHDDGKKSSGRHNSASIDRIDNTKGYVPGNIRIISWRANSLIKDASLEELWRVVEYMKAESVRASIGGVRQGNM